MNELELIILLSESRKSSGLVIYKYKIDKIWKLIYLFKKIKNFESDLTHLLEKILMIARPTTVALTLLSFPLQLNLLSLEIELMELKVERK